ncbi:MAG: MFS transporter [Candidatus Stahlbacteria bacterium]|nr:MAG: MFS transporter [Candidatus Stahlbacteria bacterium]
MKNFIEKRRDGLKLLTRAFGYRNFRLYFGGHTVSLIGYWMQRVTLGWLVYRITNSPLILGVVGFTTMIPNFFISPFAGVLIDRVSRHRVILTSQILASLQALVLAVLTLTDVIQLWHVIALSLFYGLIRAFDIPARQAFIVQMVEQRENVGNAIALNSAIFNIARLIGPSLAGLVVAFAGEGICFLTNSAAYLVIICCLLLMRLAPMENRRKDSHPVQDLKEGVRYAYGTGSIRSILVLISVIALMGLPYLNLMPVVAKDVLAGDSRTFGYLMGAVGVGAVIGALIIGTRKSFVGLWKMLPAASVIFGAAIAASSFSRNVYLSIGLMALAGFGQMVQFASANTLVQNIVDEDKRGRVMSLYTMSLLGVLPFGNLLMGWLADRIGAPLTLLAGGSVVVVAALIFATRLGHFREIAITHSSATRSQNEP